jgi:3-dehydroquinate synthase
VTVAASLVRRGISHVRLPTTLIGQVDAGIGIKGAANQGSAKNYLGCFHPPDSVVVAPQLLRSLPTVAMRQGMAEIAKIAVIRDRALFDLLQAHGPALVASRFAEPAPAAASVLVRAIAGMLAELGANPLEDRSHARAVDFGHTISPILEPATGYELHHGLAVAIDMAFSAVLARLLGLIPAAEADAILALLLALDLPIAHPRLDASLIERAFASAVLHRGGALNLVLPTGIGAHTFISRREEIGQATIEEALGQLNAVASGARPVRAA